MTTLTWRVLDPATGKTGVVTATLPPIHPASTQMMVGVEKDGTARAKWNIIRAYNQAEALNVPAGMAIAVSYTPTLGTGWSSDPAKVAALKANLQGLPDRPGTRAIAFHEPEDNYGRTAAGAALYCADEAVFESLVQQVNVARKNPLIPCRDFMAYSLQPAAWGTALTARVRRSVRKAFAKARVVSTPPELAHYHRKWLANAEMRVRRFVRRGLAKVGLATAPPDLSLYCQGMGNDVELGLDVYSIAQIAMSVKFAQQQGKTLCIPEMGPLSAVPHNDPAITSYMQQGLAAFQAAAATWLAWFDKNGSGADLDQYPNGLTFLKSQIAA